MGQDRWIWRTNLLLVCVAVFAGCRSAAEAAASAQQGASPLESAASAAASSTSRASESSACAKQCFETAKHLGFDRVAQDSLACFLGYKGKPLGTYDCCDKAEKLLGHGGEMAECLCCPEFAKAMLNSLPYDKMDITAAAYLEKLHLCRVPILGQSTCNADGATHRRLQESTAAPGSSSGSGSHNTVPLIGSFNLTGLYPYVGFDSQFDPDVLAAQGRAAVVAAKTQQVKVIGASPIYNDYVTGFAMWIERETPRYSTPKMPKLPPLPDQYKDDVLWVANLRRGPYPDLVKNRPAEYSPARTDPLQNGQISRLPPGPAYVGKLTAFASPSASKP